MWTNANVLLPESTCTGGTQCEVQLVGARGAHGPKKKTPSTRWQTDFKPVLRSRS
jgi:hypothetical protein